MCSPCALCRGARCSRFELKLAASCQCLPSHSAGQLFLAMEQKWRNAWPLLDVGKLWYPHEVHVKPDEVVWRWGNRPHKEPSIRLISEDACVHKHYEQQWLEKQENSLQDNLQAPATWEVRTRVQVAHGATAWRLVELAVDLHDINPELWKVVETWVTSSAWSRPSLVVIS